MYKIIRRFRLASRYARETYTLGHVLFQIPKGLDLEPALIPISFGSSHNGYLKKGSDLFLKNPTIESKYSIVSISTASNLKKTFKHINVPFFS